MEIVSTVFLVAVVVPVAFAISYGITRDFFGIGRLIALRRMPETTRKLGFKEKPGSSPRCFNEYKGKYKGHTVKLLPESSEITVYMRHMPVPNNNDEFKLGTSYRRTNFDTGDVRFDRFFTERRAIKKAAEKIAASDELIAHVGLVHKRWKRKCNFLEVRFDCVSCVMLYGNSHFIPAPVLEPILSDMVQLADLLDQAINEK